MDKHENKTPPRNTLHVNRWSDLPDCVDPANYSFIKDGKVLQFTIKKKTRQVLEGLLKQPVACASKCRISDRVLLLRRDYGLDIEMRMYKAESEGESFGVYFLNSDVHHDLGSEAA